ncbi:ribosomal RNA small subunit methyltransferase G-like isoform X3 [Gossypium australe]|uniref:Ribosomal RNA small subunit methyltransferase G-like isoform X3 n=1 Tax=Gossypium australe TaxID=47621 RepID=A0A5B6V6H9_9ROSI|nr:ribosomal RNA small subunit methyltransferase G-like isoform X3 [Gossypium australe]
MFYRCKILNVNFPSSMSLGTFVKHLPFSKPKTSFPPQRLNFKSPTTTTTCVTRSSSYFETLNSRQKDQIHLYVDALLQWNQKMNLTAVNEVNEVMERHIEDSLAIIPPIQNSYISSCNNSFDNLRIVDVGSGAGLPGLVLAVACPGWEVTLVESMNKRCLFLEHAVSLIGLSNVLVVRERAERIAQHSLYGFCNYLSALSMANMRSSTIVIGQKLGQDSNFRERFDVAVARAVAEMKVLAEYCLPLVRVGGLFVAAKGHNPQDEVKSAERATKLMGASVLQLCSDKSKQVVVCLITIASLPCMVPLSPIGFTRPKSFLTFRLALDTKIRLFHCSRKLSIKAILIKKGYKVILTFSMFLGQFHVVESHSPHGQRTAIICLKTRPTPRKYPRDPGTPTKEPL